MSTEIFLYGFLAGGAMATIICGIVAILRWEDVK